MPKKTHDFYLSKFLDDAEYLTPYSCSTYLNLPDLLDKEFIQDLCLNNNSDKVYLPRIKRTERG